MRTKPRPEDFLELLERSRRGRLKIYLGYAAGVGKTYRMLEEAQSLKRRGVDVVLAYIEPHDRIETQALVAGLEVIPRRKIPFHGVAVEELDLDAVVARKPTVAVVDELAHTNAPTLKNAKRYEDVLDILAAGINVLGALNVQHVESLNDLVRRTTGITVRETVPDSFLSTADQVVNVDVSNEDLIDRLKAGKVYQAAKVEQALSGFFKPENLASLREVTLREIAEKVGRQRERSAVAGAADPATAERVLVCMASNSPKAKELLRRGSRLAGRLNARWFVATVTPARESALLMDSQVQRRLHEHLEFAQELGAEVVRLEGEDPVAALLEFARAHGVQHIVVGRSFRPRWYEILRGSFIERLVRAARGLEIHVVTFEDSP